MSISHQLTMFLYALLLGGLFGIIYDVFRVSRLAFRLPWGLVLLEDITFFLLSAVLLFGYFLEQNSGEVRIFAVLGVLLGWVIYFFTLGTIVMRLSGLIIRIITKFIAAVTKPVKKAYILTITYIGKAIKLIISGANRLKSRLCLLYNIRR
ncbi:MAG: spore cortex biosynthesis protein YabQ [Angelakisella sp.]